VTGHKDLLDGNPYLKQRIQLRSPYVTALNVLQAHTLKRIRDPTLSKELDPSNKEDADLVSINPNSEYAPGLEDTLILTMKGIAAGLQNTG